MTSARPMPFAALSPSARAALFLALVMLACVVPISAKAQERRAAMGSVSDTNAPGKAASIAPPWGDLGDGTYANPVLPADFSDLDAIRVGTDYYAISSTFQYSPGMVILHSKDLVNWTIVGHAVSDLTQIGPDLNWDRMDRYRAGIWAGSIRYHDNKFWIYFNTPNEGFFVTTAPSAAGPWSPLHCLWRVSGWDDPCPFWDDDGQGYLVASHFADGYKIHLFKLSADGSSLDMASDRVIHQSRGSEANKLYKIKGMYYHYFSEVHSEGRVIMMGRAKSLDGPWEIRQLNHVNRVVDKEPNQGGLIELPDGTWQFFTHQGHGDWEGRAACLLPVTWIDGWPIIGKVGKDGIGTMVWTAPKPVPGFPRTSVVADDEFETASLRPEWEWNYQSRSDKWSLTERSGYLRLHAFKPRKPGDFKTAGNTLTQRSMRTSRNEVTVKIDLTGMADGQTAGLVHYSARWCVFGVTQSGSVRTLTCDRNGDLTRGPIVAEHLLWLRSRWDATGLSQFSYSLDGKTFVAFSPTYPLTWGDYRGDRIGICTFNDASEAGYVDVDWLHYTTERPRSELSPSASR